MVSQSASPVTSVCAADLPAVRGRYRFDVPLADSVWFRVGGVADVLFKPADAQDLAAFMGARPPHLPITVLGVGSNLLVRDGGVRGVVIRLAKGFTDIHFDADHVTVGGGVLDQTLAKVCLEHERGGLEFLSGIPGTIGGAVFMNAGAYGNAIKDIVQQITVCLADGTLTTLRAEDCGFEYRKSHLPAGAIVTSATFKTRPDKREHIQAAMDQIKQQRETSQPVRMRTGGSTFKNPPHKKAWELIDAAGLRGYKIGGAMVSDKHTNFLINTGDATAADIEALGQMIIKTVQDKFGITLNWEIQRLGEPKGPGENAHDQS